MGGLLITHFQQLVRDLARSGSLIFLAFPILTPFPTQGSKKAKNMENELQEVKPFATDVLIIGGGGAGFRAAIGAREKGAKVILTSKGSLARSGASPMGRR